MKYISRLDRPPTHTSSHTNHKVLFPPRCKSSSLISGKSSNFTISGADDKRNLIKPGSCIPCWQIGTSILTYPVSTLTGINLLLEYSVSHDSQWLKHAFCNKSVSWLYRDPYQIPMFLCSNIPLQLLAELASSSVDNRQWLPSGVVVRTEARAGATEEEPEQKLN